MEVVGETMRFGTRFYTACTVIVPANEMLFRS